MIEELENDNCMIFRITLYCRFFYKRLIFFYFRQHSQNLTMPLLSYNNHPARVYILSEKLLC